MLMAMAGKVDEDGEQVRRAKAGDFSAFEALVSKYERPIYTLARRVVGNAEDAEDVVQETFSSVVEHLGEFREAAAFYTWISRIAMNHALKLIRKRRGLPTVPLNEDQAGTEAALPHPDFIAPWTREPGEAAADPALRPQIDRALLELDEKYRTIFLLRDVEGLSTEAAAQALGISTANVKVRLLRARLQLRERLTRVFGDPARQMTPPATHE
jgi:RNA polymerase sigma-70 factor (ECF subfamily)